MPLIYDLYSKIYYISYFILNTIILTKYLLFEIRSSKPLINYHFKNIKKSGTTTSVRNIYNIIILYFPVAWYIQRIVKSIHSLPMVSNHYIFYKNLCRYDIFYVTI